MKNFLAHARIIIEVLIIVPADDLLRLRLLITPRDTILIQSFVENLDFNFEKKLIKDY